MWDVSSCEHLTTISPHINLAGCSISACAWIHTLCNLLLGKVREVIIRVLNGCFRLLFVSRHALRPTTVHDIGGELMISLLKFQHPIGTTAVSFIFFQASAFDRHDRKMKRATSSHVFIVLLRAWSFILSFRPSIAGGVMEAHELLVGDWSLKLHGILGFDLCKLFPLSSGLSADGSFHVIQHTGHSLAQEELPQKSNRPKRHQGLFSSSWLHRRTGPLDCQLTIHPNGTFTILPGDNQFSEMSAEGGEYSLKSFMPLRGRWQVLPNPYCVTDRSYDQVVLESYPRIEMKVSASKAGELASCGPSLETAGTRRNLTVESDQNKGRKEGMDVVKLSLNCRMWGRYNRPNGGLFGKWRPNYVRGRMTHGTLVWDDTEEGPTSNTRDSKSQRQRRSIVASFSALRPVKLQSNQDYHNDSEEIFGY